VSYADVEKKACREMLVLLKSRISVILYLYPLYMYYADVDIQWVRSV